MEAKCCFVEGFERCRGGEDEGLEMDVVVFWLREGACYCCGSSR